MIPVHGLILGEWGEEQRILLPLVEPLPKRHLTQIPLVVMDVGFREGDEDAAATKIQALQRGREQRNRVVYGEASWNGVK